MHSITIMTAKNIDDVAEQTGRHKSELIKMLIVFNHLIAVKVPYRNHKAITDYGRYIPHDR